ncbi:MAG: nuclear transport factor 2 family protein [Hyphomicrobium sp.]
MHRPTEPRKIIRTFIDAWAVGDLDAAFDCVAEDAIYVLHVAETTLPHGGERRGRPAIRKALAKSWDNFEYILFRQLPLSGSEDVLRGQVEFMFRHRRSGEVISGTLRHVWMVRNGLIQRCEEYHDAAKLDAFMRLVGG